MGRDRMPEKRIATLERLLARHRKFVLDAHRHIPVLINPKPDPADYRAALAWWVQCCEKVIPGSSD
jgi:hypothetical protein